MNDTQQHHVEIGWHNAEKTILLETYGEKPTISDYRYIVDERNRLIATQSHTVHEIIDLRAVKQMPSNILLALQYGGQNPPPDNHGLAVIVGLGSFMEMIIGAAQRIYPAAAKNNYTATSIEEAEQMITAYRE